MSEDTPATAGPKPPRDVWTYRIAVASVGVALVAFLVGVSVVLANGHTVPGHLWDAGSAIAGALLGILVPEPSKPAALAADAFVPAGSAFSRAARSVWRGAKAAGHEVWANRSITVLTAIFGLTTAFGIVDNVSLLQQLASASGGALIGQLAPSPATPS